MTTPGSPRCSPTCAITSATTPASSSPPMSPPCATPTAARTQPWTYTELHRPACPSRSPIARRGRLTASHNSEAAPLAARRQARDALGYQRRRSEPGMWFQVELPAETEISGLLLEYGQVRQRLSRAATKWNSPTTARPGPNPSPPAKAHPAPYQHRIPARPREIRPHHPDRREDPHHLLEHPRD